MKKSNIFICCLMFLISASASAVFADQATNSFIGRLAKQINYAEQNQQTVWPGFHPASKPTIVAFMMHNYRSFAYALNFKPGALPWEELSIENMPIYYLSNTNDLNITDDDALTEIDGQTSFVDIEQSNYLAIENLSPKIITGEASVYLKYESAIDPAHAKYMNVSYDVFNKINFLKLFYLEDKALTLALQDDTGKAEEALRHAVAIHQYRSSLLNEAEREFETGIEIIDGLPRFISLSSEGLNDIEFRKKSERVGCMPLNSLAGSFGMSDCVLSGFPAFASSVYARALDKKTDSLIWKKKVETKFKAPSQLAVEYYHFNEEEAKEMAQSAMQNPMYQYDRIVRVVDYTMASYVNSLEHATTTYQNMRGVPLRLSFEFGYLILLINAMNGGENISNFYMVNSHSMLLEDINLNSDDDSFSFKHLPYLLINEVSKGYDLDELNSYVTIKLSEEGELIFDDHKTIPVIEFVQKKMVKSFQTLMIKDQNVKLRIDQTGSLDASQGLLVLKGFEQQKLAKLKGKHLKDLLHEQINLLNSKQLKIAKSK